MNNFEMMKRRLEYQGGLDQESRMIQDKYKSFLKSLKYSYQAASIQLAQHYKNCLSVMNEENPELSSSIEHKVLINPDKNKQDYDDKILSVDYRYGFQPGDVVKWIGTNSYWLIYLEELTEDAYFRGEIRRCKYKIRFKDEEGNWLSTWAAIRGPVETQIDSIQKNQQRLDRPNLSLNILLPRNPKTLIAFERYKEFLFAGRSWRVQALDSISITNVIEIAAEESFIDRDTDDVENEIKDGLVVVPLDETPDSGIEGETWIKPLIPWTYTVEESGGTWSVDNNAPVTLAQSDDGKTVTVIWNKTSHGQFSLSWTNGEVTYVKVIVVESLL